MKAYKIGIVLIDHAYLYHDVADFINQHPSLSVQATQAGSLPDIPYSPFLSKQIADRSKPCSGPRHDLQSVNNPVIPTIREKVVEDVILWTTSVPTCLGFFHGSRSRESYHFKHYRCDNACMSLNYPHLFSLTSILPLICFPGNFRSAVWYFAAIRSRHPRICKDPRRISSRSSRIWPPHIILLSSCISVDSPFVSRLCYSLEPREPSYAS
jgi:hypothetical protein